MAPRATASATADPGRRPGSRSASSDAVARRPVARPEPDSHPPAGRRRTVLRGGSDDGRSRLLVPDRQVEEFGVELRQAAGVRRLDRRTPPHTACSRSHPVSLPCQARGLRCRCLRWPARSASQPGGFYFLPHMDGHSDGRLIGRWIGRKPVKRGSSATRCSRIDCLGKCGLIGSSRTVHTGQLRVVCNPALAVAARPVGCVMEPGRLGRAAERLGAGAVAHLLTDVPLLAWCLGQ